MTAARSTPMKTFFLGLGAFVFTAFALLGAAKADTTREAADFVQKLGNRAVGTLADKNVSPEEASKVFRNMLETSFDVDLIGKFALGPANWKAITPEQKQEYLRLFQKLVVQIYSDRFKLYDGETFKVISSKAEDERDSYVVSSIEHPKTGAPPIAVDWRVRNKGGRQQVIDVIVEGVSMTVTQRAEFLSVLQQNGGDFDAFLKILGDRVADIT